MGFSRNAQHYTPERSTLLYTHSWPNMLKNGKAIPVTGREGPEDCEMSRLPHFLDNRLTDGSKVVSLMHRSPLPFKFTFYDCSTTSCNLTNIPFNLCEYF
jgi:hypothetical protein